MLEEELLEQAFVIDEGLVVADEQSKEAGQYGGVATKIGKKAEDVVGIPYINS